MVPTSMAEMWLVWLLIRVPLFDLAAWFFPLQ
jgi:hypothetical protein